ncbi:MAG: NAD(P)/FAD-dependent oxidoreductase [Gemmatimonadota bacterium]
MKVDVVVVGAGPAGSTTAGLLASAGHRVLLLDRARFPRTKPCGESVNPGALRELERLGTLPAVARLPHAPIPGWGVHLVGGGAFHARFPSGERGMAVDRAAFDDALLRHAEAAGAEVRTGARVVDVVRRKKAAVGVRLSSGEEAGCRLLVGADGLRSIVVRRLGLLRRHPRLRKVALTAHLELGSEAPELGEMHMRSWGCIGVVAVGRGVVNVVVVLNEPTARLVGDAAGAFDDAVRSVPVLAGACRVADVMATGPFDWPTRSVTADGALLVGDAAGYFDPFTGQGIYRALRGARMAAAVASRCLQHGDCSRAALAPYATAHRRAFAAGRRLQRVIESVVSRPAALNAFATAARAWPALPERLFAVTGDIAEARRLLF